MTTKNSNNANNILNISNIDSLNDNNSLGLKDFDMFSDRAFGDKGCTHPLQIATASTIQIPDLASINAGFSVMKNSFDNLCEETDASFNNVDKFLEKILTTVNEIIAALSSPSATMEFNKLPHQITSLGPVF